MNKKIRITKKRNERLGFELSFDDYLYEKFRRQEIRIREQYERYVSNPRKLWGVVQKLPDGSYIKHRVLKVNVGPDGSEVIIG